MGRFPNSFWSLKAPGGDNNDVKVLRRLVTPRKDGSYLVPVEYVEKFKDIAGGGRAEVLRFYKDKCNGNKDWGSGLICLKPIHVDTKKYFVNIICRIHNHWLIGGGYPVLFSSSCHSHALVVGHLHPDLSQEGGANQGRWPLGWWGVYDWARYDWWQHSTVSRLHSQGARALICLYFLGVAINMII